jgi:DNA-binding transcriptional MocR family regulator
MLLLTADRRADAPIHRQIVDQIRAKIEAGELPHGERLPSTRRLAELLGVHRATVALAYQELWSLGYLELREKAAPQVRQRRALAGGRATEGRRLDWDAFSSPASRVAFAEGQPWPTHSSDGSVINLASLDLGPALFPVARFQECLTRVLRQHGANLLGYGDRLGYPPLREYLARRLRQHGITVSSAEVLVTNGSQHGLDLILRLAADGRRGVAVEAPTYDTFLRLLHSHGHPIHPVPMTPAGIDLAALERVLHTAPLAYIYTIPTFHNPSGISTGQAHREQLLALAEQYRVPLIEDGFDEEMKYFGATVLPIKSMDRMGCVLYCGTFSKVLFPGCRIGWVVADQDCIARLGALRRAQDLSSSPLLQAALWDFCEHGYFDRHLVLMHRVFKGRMRCALQALRRHVAMSHATWSEPAGGYLLWLQLPAGIDGADVAARALQRGVRVLSGRSFFQRTPRTRSFLRLSLSGVGEAEIEEGIRRLAIALDHACRDQARAPVRRSAQAKRCASRAPRRGA